MSTRTNPARARRWPPKPTTAQAPWGGLAISLVLHVALIVATYLTWQHITAPSDITHAVPVDLITVARQTNVAAQAPPPPKLDIPKPSVEQPDLPKFESVEPAPVPPVPQIKIKPDEKKPTNKDFSALLDNLTKPAPPPKNAKVGARTIQGVGASNLMTASLVDALRSQIAKCWSPQVGAPRAADLIVSFNIKLNRNGTVASAGMTSETIARSSNPYTQAAVTAASSAIYRCQPYNLPPERISEWSDIIFTFDPSRMMDQ